MELGGQNAVVIGATSMMGIATAKRLRDHDCQVALLGFNKTAGQDSADEIGCRFYAVDLNQPESVDTAFAQIFRDFGEIRIVINLAATAEINYWTVDRSGKPFSLDKFSRTINVNLVAALQCTALASAHMAKLDPLDHNERGVIIHTSSIAGFEPSPGEVAYACSKAGLVAMTRAVAADLNGSGVRCCAIAPGVTWTKTMMPVKRRMKWLSRFLIPFPKRLVEPEEYAALVQQIIENRSMNGACVRIDGAFRKGRRARGRPNKNA